MSRYASLTAIVGRQLARQIAATSGVRLGPVAATITGRPVHFGLIFRSGIEQLVFWRDSFASSCRPAARTRFFFFFRLFNDACFDNMASAVNDRALRVRPADLVRNPIFAGFQTPVRSNPAFCEFEN